MSAAGAGEKPLGTCDLHAGEHAYKIACIWWKPSTSVAPSEPGKKSETITLDNCGPENAEFNKNWHLVSANRRSCYGTTYARPGEAVTTANVGAWYNTACYWRDKAESLERSAAPSEGTPKPVNEWQRAVEEACIVLHLSFEGEPRAVLSNLIAYEVSIALDPKVSEAAQKLIDVGQAGAGTDAATPKLTLDQLLLDIKSEVNDGLTELCKDDENFLRGNLTVRLKGILTHIRAFEAGLEAGAISRVAPELNVEDERARIMEYLHAKGRVFANDDYVLFEAGWLAYRIAELERAREA